MNCNSQCMDINHPTCILWLTAWAILAILIIWILPQILKYCLEVKKWNAQKKISNEEEKKELDQKKESYDNQLKKIKDLDEKEKQIKNERSEFEKEKLRIQYKIEVFKYLISITDPKQKAKIEEYIKKIECLNNI